jgi:hypothetical protein
MKYLVTVYYVDPDVYQQYLDGEFDTFEDFDYVASTGLYINAESEEKAVDWGKEIAKEYCDFFFKEKNYDFNYEDFGCYSHANIKNGWEHCLEFFQIINDGEFPDFNKMKVAVYLEWLKENRPDIYKSVNYMM